LRAARIEFSPDSNDLRPTWKPARQKNQRPEAPNVQFGAPGRCYDPPEPYLVIGSDGIEENWGNSHRGRCHPNSFPISAGLQVPAYPGRWCFDDSPPWKWTSEMFRSLIAKLHLGQADVKQKKKKIAGEFVFL